MTMNSMTRFEKCRILGARALQISLGAPVLVDDLLSETDPINLAGIEFERSLVPINVMRTLPDGGQERVEVNDSWEK